MIRVEWAYPWPALRIALRARARALADFRPLHEAAGQRLVDWLHRNFRAGGGLLQDQPAGWPPLAAATLRDRRRRGLGLDPLIASGRLSRGFAIDANTISVTVANPVPYARFHQAGDGVPRRAIFPQSAQAGRIVFPDVLRHVQGALA